MTNDRTEIVISDLRLMIKTLRALDSKYVGEFYKRAKEIAKPIQKHVIDGIPSTPPVRGMRAKSMRGRLAWGVGKRAKSVVIRANRTVQRKSAFAKGKSNEYPIVQVVAQSPALVMADMAGKTNAYTNKKVRSRKHEINLFGRGVIVERTYKINNQGRFLIEALANSSKSISKNASRFFWPSAIKGMPEAKVKMDALIKELHERTNKSLGT
jgi:hypothetical protein